MAFNNNQPTITVYTPISFSNTESKINRSRLSISYFNRLMKLSIANAVGKGSDGYIKYDNDREVSVYISPTKAGIFARLLREYFLGKKNDNVCIELKNGLLKVFRIKDAYAISISSANDKGDVTETIYECKPQIGAYNYKNNEYSEAVFADFEIEYLTMVFEEYYKASSYAIAASVHEAALYRNESKYNLLRAIADKVGASTGSRSNSTYNSKSFLSGGNKSSSESTPKEYEAASFDDIANSLGLNEDD